MWRQERGGSKEAKDNVKLLVGPWLHDPGLDPQVGELNFGLRSAAKSIDLLGIHLRWFDYWLKGIDNGIMDEAPVQIFVMGDNVWRHENEWPLERTQYTKYYFHSDGCANSSSSDGKLNKELPGAEEYDSYIYNPRYPVPTKGGNLLGQFGMAGALDQREVEEREDVLVYTTLPLREDIEITGPVIIKLFAASSAPDTDFTGKLVHVWPNGKAYILIDGIIRARYKESGKSPSLIEPEKVYEYSIDLGATSTVFKIGHRIRVEISSSNFPRFDRNPNTDRAFGEDSEIVIAKQKIFHDRLRASHIVLPVIPR